MFTYKAVEENSQVIACDIARYLFQGEVTDAAPGSHAPCTVSNGSQTTPGIVIVSSDSSLLADFQIWRADMATMSALEARANNVCVAAPEAKGENGQEGTPPPRRSGRGVWEAPPLGSQNSPLRARLSEPLCSSSAAARLSVPSWAPCRTRRS